MSEIQRSLYGPAWGETGEKIEPALDKIELGWIQEMMPYQWENWLTERQDRQIKYLLQKGIPEFIRGEQYIGGKSFIAYNGAIYVCLQDTDSVLPPTASHWKRVSAISDNSGVVTVAGGGTGAVTADAARVNLGLGDIAVQNKGQVTLTGGSIDGITIGGTTAAAGKFTTIVSVGNVTAPTFIGALSGNAATATVLQTARNISISGAATGTATLFNGSTDISIPVTSLDASKLTGSTTVNTSGNAGSATKLAVGRSFSISGKVTAPAVSFDGTTGVNLVVESVAADTANKLTTARLIGGVAFDGSQDINLPGVNNTGNQNTTGNAATATKLANARKINGVNFDGTADVQVNWKSIPIPTNSNLNAFISEGVYSANDATVASYLTNAPTTFPFSLRVWEAGGVIQEVTEIGTLRRSFTRSLQGTVWTEWKLRVDNVGGATSATQLAAGTIDQRPLSAAAGAMRLNTTNKIVEVWDGTQWGQVGTVSSQGLPTFAVKPLVNSGPAILVTTPHIRFMVWSGTEYVRAPWHLPGNVIYTYENKASVPGHLPLRGDVVYQQEDYPDLARYLGLSGTGTFTLAETRGEFIRVLDNGRGIDVNRTNGSFQASQNLSHTHTGATGGAGEHSHTVAGSTDVAGWHSHGVNDPGHSHTVPQGGVSGGNFFQLANGYGSDRTTSVSGSNISIQGGGEHAHSVSGTTSTVWNHAHSVSVDAAGGNESRPRNIAFSLWISY